MTKNLPYISSDREGRFAGTHLILDVWNGQGFNDLQMLQNTLKGMAHAAGATILNVDLHSFENYGGVTGVITLSESHISVHTWPELAYAAFDIFMCGKCDPYLSIEVLKKNLLPERVEITEIKRGRHTLSSSS